MLYIIADKQKAARAGLSLQGCLVKNNHVVLNEKELNIVPGETLEDRAAAIGGKVYDVIELKKLIKKGDW